MAKKIDRKLNGEDIVEKEFGDFLENGGSVGGDISSKRFLYRTGESLTNGQLHQSVWGVSNNDGTDSVRLAIGKASTGQKVVYNLEGDCDLGALNTYPFKDVYIKGNSRSTNGYTKLPNGLILQWGRVAIGVATEVLVTFPITFPNKVLQVVSNAGYCGGGTGYLINYGATATGFGVKASGSYVTEAFYVAIGY